MLELTAEQFGQRAYDLNLIDARELESVWSQCGTHNVSSADFLKILVRREILTNYQVDRLLRGEKSGFFYGDYKVLYLVGTGSFARVYRSVHKDTHDIVAVKVLRKRHSEDPLELDRFLREGRMGMQLRHPNVVPIYGVHSVGREHFLVMAFIEGQSLREFIRIRRKLEPLEATQIMEGVLAGLTYASEKGITHRDLKLSNVLLSNTEKDLVDRPKLVDFGLAGGGDRGGNTARTVDYAGLEKLTGVDKDDARSDIYFAGCMYYHLLTGHAPLTESKDKFQRMNISRFREVKPIRDLSPDLPSVVEVIVEKAMNLTVRERYSRPVDMRLDLNRAAKALQTVADRGDHSGSSLSLAGHRSQSVLVVESHAGLQSALRDGLKKRGYAVLVMEDPERAWQRILDAPQTVGCVIVSTGTLGRAALKLYQDIRKYPRSSSTPSVLLLAKSHTSLQEKLGLPQGVHRVVTMPLRVSDLLRQVEDIFQPADRLKA